MAQPRRMRCGLERDGAIFKLAASCCAETKVAVADQEIYLTQSEELQVKNKRQSADQTMNSQSKQRPELFWPRVVVRKWLNISSKDSDYSADSEDDYASSDSASDTSEFVQRESRFGSNRGEDVQGI
ncbi:hypothetical protein NC652_014474 [Populus alba x Populus x berolinensis]|nr:hypothetical protein NC652_014474 [Populus alba x Populus x berolinensis]